VPIRWQCPEAVLTRVYTAKSDVYSFGVLLFEIYSGGGTPHGNLAASEVLQMVKGGHVLSRPSAAMTDDVFMLMRACTALNVGQRPSMTTLHARLLGVWTLESPLKASAATPLPPGMALNQLRAVDNGHDSSLGQGDSTDADAETSL